MRDRAVLVHDETGERSRVIFEGIRLARFGGWSVVHQDDDGTPDEVWLNQEEL